MNPEEKTYTRRHTIYLYENFTYIGEVLRIKNAQDNTEGSRKTPVETKCEIAKIYFGESYSPIPLVIEVRSLLLKRDNERSKI